MNKITEESIRAFLNHERYVKSNMRVNSKSMYLFDNKIAWWDGNELWISTCGWKSKTTKERLNALPNVSIKQRNGIWYLNGIEWDGSPICVNGMNDLRIDGDC